MKVEKEKVKEDVTPQEEKKPVKPAEEPQKRGEDH